MDPLNGLISLLILYLLLFAAYHLGKKEGRKQADKILGIENHKALQRIKRQADRNL